MSVTKQQYEEACARKDQAEKVMNQYVQDLHEKWKERWKRFDKENEYFTDADLIYAAHATCEKCGAGMAYPKDCDPWHQWTCSAVLKGVGTDKGHTALPFIFYEIKSEQQPSAHGATTRPKPKLD